MSEEVNLNRMLFVYGTLRAGALHPMARWLRGHARPFGRAWLLGRLYDLGPYPGAVASVCGGGRVVGELWRLHRRSDLRRLDAYEGVFRRGRPAEYCRRRVIVNRGKLAVEAWVYLYDRPVRFRRRIPCGDWLRRR